MASDDMLIFAGSGSPRLTGRICQRLLVSVAPLFAEAVRRIHNRESISDLFPGALGYNAGP